MNDEFLVVTTFSGTPIPNKHKDFCLVWISDHKRCPTDCFPFYKHPRWWDEAFHISALVLVPQGSGSRVSATPTALPQLSPCQGTSTALQGHLDTKIHWCYFLEIYVRNFFIQCKYLMGASQVHLTHITNAAPCVLHKCLCLHSFKLQRDFVQIQNAKVSGYHMQVYHTCTFYEQWDTTH